MEPARGGPPAAPSLLSRPPARGGSPCLRVSCSRRCATWGLASGVRAAGAFLAGGEVVVLEVGEGTLLSEWGRLKVAVPGPKEAVVVLNGKRTTLRVEGER